MEPKVIKSLEEWFNMPLGSSFRAGDGTLLVSTRRNSTISMKPEDYELFRRASPLVVLWEAPYDLEYDEIRAGGYSRHGVPVLFVEKDFPWETMDDWDTEEAEADNEE